MQATVIKADGAYIYPDTATGKFSALVAWWYGGTLRNLGLLHVPVVEHRDAILKEQLTQMAWSGELEGWLNGQPHWYSLVADESHRRQLAAAFSSVAWSRGGSAGTGFAHATGDLERQPRGAGRSRRGNFAARILDPLSAGIRGPPVDAVFWERSSIVYLAGVIIYLGGAAVGKLSRGKHGCRTCASRSRAYTNVLQIKAQLEILQNRQALKFASLDCWQKTAELLPENISVGTARIQGRQTLQSERRRAGRRQPATHRFQRRSPQGHAQRPAHV